jgi:RNA polymerase sigma-70 factor (ECF subfamily)
MGSSPRDAAPADDLALFAAWQGGDRQSGELLFERYYDSLARFFHNKVSEAASPDLIQNTFLACLEGRARIIGTSGFRGYLFGVAHNLLRHHYRGRRRQGESLDLDRVSASDLEPSMSQILGARQEQRLLLEALRRIPIDCQIVCELHYWEQLGTTEIGEILGVPPGTVKSRLQRGRRLLEEQLAALATSAELLQTTLSNLEKWAADLRHQLSQKSPG